MLKHKSTYVILIAIHLALLAIFAAYRLIDADEGVYFSAARMVSEGMSVYTDFFYTQLSMMPTIFAPFAQGGWESFYILRGFAVLAGLFSALLFLVIIWKLSQDNKTTTIIMIAYLFSGIIIAWNATFKALPFCHFMSLAVFFFWLRFYEKKNLSSLIMTGLFLSALINFRSVFAVLLPFYLISIGLMSENKKLRNLIVFMVSLIPLTIPTLMKIIESPQNFKYGNWVFQLYREGDNSLGHVLSNRMEFFLRALADPHLLIIFVLTVISILLLIRQKAFSGIKDIFVKPEGAALMNLLLIAGVHLIPNPISRQYINQFMAFALIIISFNFKFIYDWFISKFSLSVVRIISYGIAGIYILSLVPYCTIFIFGSRDYDRRYNLSEVRAVTEHMLKVATESDTVLSEWPGYAFITEQTPLRYSEIIGTEFDLPMSHEEYLKYNLGDGEYFRDEIGKATPKLIVFQNNPSSSYADLLEQNYEQSFKSDVVSVYKRK
ncbi:MAG: hypothetical protein ABIJ45_06505 [Candidatus Zixiibacteriota bacterium]